MAEAGKAMAAIQELMRRGVSPNEVYRQTGMKQGIDGKWAIPVSVGIVQPVRTEASSTSYGKRADGSEKGSGFFGELKRPDGGISTELSIGVGLGDKEIEIPLLTPNQSKSDIEFLLGGGAATKEMVDRAVQHAIPRLRKGLSPFAQPNEPIRPLR
jgi:hypothetical protein